MTNKTMIQESVSSRFSVAGFQIVSATELEIDEDYNLVKGTALKVINSTGEVIHDGVRAFMPINDSYHLVRLIDGSWWYCMPDGQPKRKRALFKKNLVIDGSKAVMFDERGKIRLGQQNAQYPMLSVR